MIKYVEIKAEQITWRGKSAACSKSSRGSN
jgi:hypothetical protein